MYLFILSFNYSNVFYFIIKIVADLLLWKLSVEIWHKVFFSFVLVRQWFGPKYCPEERGRMLTGRWAWQLQQSFSHTVTLFTFITYALTQPPTHLHLNAQFQYCHKIINNTQMKIRTRNSDRSDASNNVTPPTVIE